MDLKKAIDIAVKKRIPFRLEYAGKNMIMVMRTTWFDMPTLYTLKFDQDGNILQFNTLDFDVEAFLSEAEKAKPNV